MSELSNLERIRHALKYKGIGPSGSKGLAYDELKQILLTLCDPDIPEATGTAFWCACLLLNPNREEQLLLRTVYDSPNVFLPSYLQTFLKPIDPKDPILLNSIKKVLSHQNLNEAEAESALTECWKVSTPDFLKAAFLQSTRLKRETPTENLAFLKSMWNTSCRLQVDLPVLIEFGDTYNGSNRSYRFAPFIAALLAGMEIPCLIHGVNTLAPKYGITSSQLLEYANKPTNTTLEEARKQLTNPNIRWCYLDQKNFFPELFALKQLRHDIVKRPFLATFEKVLSPIQNKVGNVMFVGYVHSGYREEIPNVLGKLHQYHSIFNLRTIEGGIDFFGKKKTSFVGLTGVKGSSSFEKVEGMLDPDEYCIDAKEHQIIRGISVKECLQAGIDGLLDKNRLASELLIYHAAAFAVLSGQILKPQHATQKAQEVLKSGKAYQHWSAL